MWFLTCFLLLLSHSQPSCDPQACTIVDHTTPGDILDAGFTKKLMVFDEIPIYKHHLIPDWALTFVATVLYTYLDGDMDGSVDDPAVFNAFRRSHCQGIAIAETNDVFPDDGELKDSFCGISRTEGETNFQLTNGFAYNVYEEQHHAIARMLASAYPDDFGYSSNSKIYEAAVELYGDCEISAQCFPSCTHYNCNENEHSCQFIEGSCNGVYHYSEPGCDLEGCISHETFWFSFGSFVDLFTEDECNRLSGEWASCTHDEFMSEPLTQKMRELVSSPGSPTIKPDGTYNPSNTPTPPEEAADMNDYVGISGEEACEGHGFDEATCTAISCCQYDDGSCFSAVGNDDCSGCGDCQGCLFEGECYPYGGEGPADAAECRSYGAIACVSNDNGCDATAACVATCPAEPTTCDEYKSMTGEGGCAENCCESLTKPYEDKLCSDTTGNGEQVCEGHGFDESTCNSIGCCQFNDGLCWSAVGNGPCDMTDCCQAMTASCLACQEGMSMDDYCNNYPSTSGCEALPFMEPPPSPFPVERCSESTILRQSQKDILAEKGFTKCCMSGFIGLVVAGTEGYPDSYLQWAANIAAGILDQDNDRVVDDQAADLINAELTQVPPLMVGGVDQAEESQGDEIGDGTNFAYAFSLQTWKGNGAENNKRILTEEVFHMITDFVYADAYPDQFGVNDFTSSVLARECSAQMCVNWYHPENRCATIGVHEQPPISPGYGDCTYPSCDCVEWFHQVALVLVGQEPGWRSPLLPSTPEALRASLSPEFLAIMDDPQYHQLSAPISWSPASRAPTLEPTQPANLCTLANVGLDHVTREICEDSSEACEAYIKKGTLNRVDVVTGDDYCRAIGLNCFAMFDDHNTCRPYGTQYRSCQDTGGTSSDHIVRCVGPYNPIPTPYPTVSGLCEVVGIMDENDDIAHPDMTKEICVNTPDRCEVYMKRRTIADLNNGQKIEDGNDYCGAFGLICLEMWDDLNSCTRGGIGQYASCEVPSSDVSSDHIIICAQPPTKEPTKVPTNVPTKNPAQATVITLDPTKVPTSNPTTNPSKGPTQSPLKPTKVPTTNPSRSPTSEPTKNPSTAATKEPTKVPTQSPLKPTKGPTKVPTQSPLKPTKGPTQVPTKVPTTNPSRSFSPTSEPTKNPSRSFSPTSNPTANPSRSFSPTSNPTTNPSRSFSPTSNPTTNPSKFRSLSPTAEPTRARDESVRMVASVSGATEGNTNDICSSIADGVDGTVTHCGFSPASGRRMLSDPVNLYVDAKVVSTSAAENSIESSSYTSSLQVPSGVTVHSVSVYVECNADAVKAWTDLQTCAADSRNGRRRLSGTAQLEDLISQNTDLAIQVNDLSTQNSGQSFELDQLRAENEEYKKRVSQLEALMAQALTRIERLEKQENKVVVL